VPWAHWKDADGGKQFGVQIDNADGPKLDLSWQVADVEQKLLLFRRYGRPAHKLRVNLEAAKGSSSPRS
jgi:hypothetical protein